jgi:hypothetical protein|tara:strand:+ start:1294 stop:2094 length:801 start_codon:yes stop_codon:yes gene_type:complete
MKFDFEIKEIDKFLAIDLIQKTHYSKVMPRLTKHYLGCFLTDKLVGVITLGWGTQPRQTINKLFPGLETKDYYEIGKMCMLEEMPRNSESQMLSKVVRWMKENTKDKLFLYTWADGIVGKPGYVYQSFNFLYGGYIWTDIYMSESGEKIHPRTSRKLCEENARMLNKEKVFWLTYDFMELKGIKRIKGKQFRYILPLSKKAKKLLKKSTVEWIRKYPKDVDLKWKEMIGKGKYELTNKKPEFNLDVIEHNMKNANYKKTIEHNFWR